MRAKRVIGRCVAGGVCAVLGAMLALRISVDFVGLFVVWLIIADVLVNAAGSSLSRRLRLWVAPTGNRLPFATAVCMAEGRRLVREARLTALRRAGSIIAVSLVVCPVFAPALLLALAFGSIRIVCEAWASVFRSLLILARGGNIAVGTIRVGSSLLWVAGGVGAYALGWGVKGIAAAGAFAAIVEGVATTGATWLHVFPTELWPVWDRTSYEKQPATVRRAIKKAASGIVRYPAHMRLPVIPVAVAAFLENEAFLLGLLLIGVLKALGVSLS